MTAEPAGNLSTGWLNGLYRWLKGSRIPAESEAGSADETRAHLPSRVGHYRIRRQLGAGGMGVVYQAHQMVCHLSDGYRLLTGEVTSQPAATPLPRAVMRWIALYVPVRWPSGIPTTPELDQWVGGTAPADFATDVADLERLVIKVAAERSGRLTGLVHPIFGSMSESAWLRWAYLHADHHLRQFGVQAGPVRRADYRSRVSSTAG